jgi:hypothetical protein
MSSSGELGDWESFAQEPLKLKIGGREYELPPVSARLGIGIATGVWDEKPMLELWMALLGPVYDEMLDNDVPYDALTRAGMVALADHQTGRQYALLLWEKGTVPEALAALTAADGTETQPQTPPGEANTTPSPDSGTSTKKPRSKAASNGET